MKTILLIEDNLEIRENVCEMLELQSYKVRVAANGRAGLATLEEELPDLILCDIMMPELTGYEVLIQLKKNAITAAIPFIFITASTEKREMQKGLDLGADAYIRKPFDNDELMDEIKRCLKEKNLSPDMK